MVRNEPILCPSCQSDDIFFRGEICICGSCGLRFQISKEEKPFLPMKLFLSYGHKEATICRFINQALKDRGHTTWFDEDKLHHGQDWRQEIADGIKKSNGVISCLSRHSVRDPGVCLNELSIAIGVRGGNIKTILLEPEKDVRPPASLCHIQWLDMSDWRSRYDRGEGIFRPWFDAKMEQLFQVIESDESREFTGQISAIQENLHINYDTSKQRDLLQRLFVGREWLTEQLERWLDDPAGPRLCILYGDPGVGKSAFAANYIHYNPRVAAGLFCEYDRPAYNNAATVIMTLSYLLACRLPAYRTALAAILEREKRLGMMNAAELFDLLLADPLTLLTIDGGHETLCAVIDGLDECGKGEYNALAEVLARYVPRLPAWLRVLVTSREVAAVKAPLAGAFVLKLHGDSSQNRADVRRYFIERLEERQGSNPAWNRALNMLTERSGGIFLYAQLVCDGILAGKLSIHDLNDFPDGLSDAFYQWFGWFFPDDREYKADFRLPLGMLLATPEPLPKEELKRIFEWDNNRLEDFLRRVEVLLRQDVDDFGKETVAFTHLYLSEWLDTELAGRFRSNRAEAREWMAERFYELFQKDTEALTEYESLHLAALLEQCGNTVKLAEVMLDHNLFQNITYAGDHCRSWGKLSTALACYEQAHTMAEQMVQERGTPDDYRNLDVSYDRVANILRDQGNLDGALELSQKSMEIRERLVREHSTLEDRRNLSVNYDRFADILKAKGDLDGALELYLKGMEIREQLVRVRGTLDDCSILNISCSLVADILHTKGDLDGALELYQKSMKISEHLMHMRGAPSDRRDLSISYAGVAGILQDRGDLNGALELYQKSMEIREQLVREKGIPEDRRGLSISYNRVADILQDRGDLSGAMELYQKCLKIDEQLVQERGIPQDRRDLSVSYDRVADILKANGDLSGAMELYLKGMEIRDRLVREWGTPEDRRGLSLSYNMVAGILRTKGDLDEALKQFQKSLEIDEQLVRERGIPRDRRNLSLSYNMVADILQTRGDLDEALELYQKSMRIREQLVQECGTLRDRRDLSVSYDDVAGILKARGNLVGTLELYQKGMRIREQLVREQGTLGDRKALCFSYNMLASILQNKGDLAGALEIYQTSMRIREQLVREQGTPENRTDLSASYNNVAHILHDKGDLAGALVLFRKSTEIDEQLVRERGAVSDYDNLAVSYYKLAALPVVSVSESLAYARRGLGLSEQLLKATGLDRYQNFCEVFHQLIDELEQPNG